MDRIEKITSLQIYSDNLILPFGLKYIINKKFIFLYSAAVVTIMKWFAQTYFQIVCVLITQMNESKVSLAQVLYTNLYKTERLALFSSLAGNSMVTKGLQMYHVQCLHPISYITTIIRILFSYPSFEERQETVKIMLNTDLDIRENSVPTISVLSAYLPTSIINIIDTVTEKMRFTGDVIIKSAMTAVRGGKIPSYDISRIVSIVDELACHGEYMYNVTIKLFVILIVLILFYIVFGFRKRENFVKLRVRLNNNKMILEKILEISPKMTGPRKKN